MINNELAEKISGLENHNRELEEDNKKLSGELEEITAELVLLQEADEFNGELAAKNFELQKLLDDLKSQYVEFDKVKVHNQELAEENLELNKTVNELSVIEKEQEIKIIDLESQLSDQKVKYYDDLKKLSEKFESERLYYEKLVNDCKLELEEKVKENQDLINEKEDLQLRLSAFLRYLDELCEKVSGINYIKSNSENNIEKVENIEETKDVNSEDFTANDNE